MLRQFKSALVIFGVLTLITGGLYPALVTGIAQMLFPFQANGSLIQHNGQVLGSTLIGQSFTDPKYFWGRISATSPYPYNAAASSGSNLGPTNPALLSEVQARIDALRAADPGNTQPIPVDLVTSSASGLDPDISPAAAYYQVPRIARLRGLEEARVKDLVTKYVQPPQFGFLGQARVNVLELNFALDRLQ